jgi:selenocysteine-specific elongation factor
MAGGRILHCDPPRRRRFDGKSLAELAILEQGDPAELFRQKLREAATTGLPAAEHAAFAADPAAQPLGRRLYDRALMDEIADRVAALADEAWRLNPLRGGVGKEEARRKARFAGSPAEWNALIEALAAARGWSAAGDRIGPAQSEVLPDGLQRAVDAVEARLRACGLDWPGAAALGADLPAGLLAGHDLEEHLRYLAARGRAVMVADDYPVHAAALAELLPRLRAHFAAEGSLNFAAFRELTGLSRKLGIPLLEHLDAAGLTRRVGDLRTIGPALKKEA